MNITRLTIHMGDAPCHGSRFHSLKENAENLEMSKKYDKPWENIFEDMKKKGIDYYAFQIEEKYTKKMFEVFQEIWNEIKFSSVRRNPRFQVLSLKDDSFSFVTKVFGSIKQSISQNLNHIMTSTLHSLRNFKLMQSIEPLQIISEDKCSTNEYQEVSGKFFKVSLKDLTSDFNDESFKTLIGESKTIFIKTHPFARGSFNYSYKALLPDTEIKLVAKQPIIPSEISDPLCRKELRKNAIVLHLAELFNKKIESLKSFNWAKIQFIQQVLFETDNRTIYMLEGEIQGHFQKYSNNLDTIDDSEEVRHLTAFAHFSYQETRGNYLVSDFQGVNRKLLTDPCIHSKTGEFRESGDFDYQGFIYFFRRHKCNDLCYKLELDIPEDLDLKNNKLCHIENWNETEFEHKSEEMNWICKNIFCHEFVKKLGNYCDPCYQFVEKKYSSKCYQCKNDFKYNLYHFEFAGLTPPKKCSYCRGNRELENL